MIGIKDALVVIVIVYVIWKYVNLVIVNAIVDDGRRERRHETVTVLRDGGSYTTLAIGRRRRGGVPLGTVTALRRLGEAAVMKAVVSWCRGHCRIAHS